jgi:hypothetical protein
MYLCYYELESDEAYNARIQLIKDAKLRKAEFDKKEKFKIKNNALINAQIEELKAKLI